jgi:hypothetical protein
MKNGLLPLLLLYVAMALGISGIVVSWPGAEDMPIGVLVGVDSSNKDEDGDGLPDWWELRYSNNTTALFPDMDSDGDGLTNLEEYKYGTHPLLKDTDNDGLEDKDEILKYFTNPIMADSDSGGRSDRDEIDHGSSPLNPDDDDKAEGINSIVLYKGWNLFSLPVTPSDISTPKVLDSISDSYENVWAYVTQSDTWLCYDPRFPQLSNLHQIEPGKGYSIKMKKTATLRVSGPSVPKDLVLINGKNLVGFNSLISLSPDFLFGPIKGKIDRVWTLINGQWDVYVPDKPGFTDLTRIEPGQGYWIYANSPCTLSIPK